jgi:hypothetical protein
MLEGDPSSATTAASARLLEKSHLLITVVALIATSFPTSLERSGKAVLTRPILIESAFSSLSDRVRTPFRGRVGSGDERGETRLKAPASTLLQ